MDTFIDTLTQLLIDWGYWGMFVSALLAGSVIPFSSELVLVGLVQLGLHPMGCVLAATVGNVLGGHDVLLYGAPGADRLDREILPCEEGKIDKMQHFLQGKGALMAFFAFLPIIGSVISIALGFMRSNLPLTVTSMFAGKLIRYIVLLWMMQGAISMIH